MSTGVIALKGSSIYVEPLSSLSSKEDALTETEMINSKPHFILAILKFEKLRRSKRPSSRYLTPIAMF